MSEPVDEPGSTALLDWPSLEEMLDRVVERGVPDVDDDWPAGPGSLTDAELIDALADLERVRNRAEARQTRLLGEFDRRRNGSRFSADEVGLALGRSRIVVAGQLTRARRLVDVLTDTLEAAETGALDGYKVRLIVDAVQHLDDGPATWVQARVLPRAVGQTPAQLRAALARAVIAVDPDGANDRHRRARQDRRVTVGAENDGMASLWALLPAPDALAAHETLTRLARSLGAEDPRSMDARRADLTIGLLTGTLTLTREDAPGSTTAPDPVDDNTDPSPVDDNTDPSPVDDNTDPSPVDDDPGTGPVDGDTRPVRSGSTTRPAPAGAKPLVQVTMAHSTLRGADHAPADLAGYGPICADLAREIAADAVWRRLVFDDLSGALLDHGRTTYRPPAALADFVRARDQHCRSPHCRRRAQACELDHTVPYPDGPTAEPNLACGCLLHHHEKHSPGWSASQHPGGTLTWTTPTGHRYTSHPADLRPEPDPPPPDHSGPGRRDPDPPPRAPTAAPRGRYDWTSSTPTETTPF